MAPGWRLGVNEMGRCTKSVDKMGLGEMGINHCLIWFKGLSSHFKDFLHHTMFIPEL